MLSLMNKVRFLTEISQFYSYIIKTKKKLFGEQKGDKNVRLNAQQLMGLKIKTSGTNFCFLKRISPHKNVIILNTQ